MTGLLSRLLRRKPAPPPVSSLLHRMEAAVQAQAPDVQAAAALDRDLAAGAAILRFREAGERQRQAVMAKQVPLNARGQFMRRTPQQPASARPTIAGCDRACGRVEGCQGAGNGGNGGCG